ncbi:S8 family serine peptidase [Saccharopolyspora rosea]|uniref:S8 family serine peptidase n=1 Tax=Saccharopolyspora rosea TaxID=524884 RepID=UPI0021DA455A|nr:S8 family serine peptidase [Saccharopolyspora rosea]
MRSRASGTALVLALSAGLAPPAAASPQLPPITQTLSGDQGCRTPSTTTAEETPWAQARLRPDRVWPHSDGSGVAVAVVDTGVDTTAPALAGKVTGAGQDCVGHGTFVAGLIAAGREPGTGFAGIAPGARVLSVPATDRTGGTDASRLAAAIRTAVSGGARVVQVSPAVTADDPALAAAVRDATAAGALVVAPATTAVGNDPVAAYPGAYPEVLSVTATSPDGTAARAGAPGADPDVAAPGTAMTGIGPGGPGLFISGGDAVAAAEVAGTAALVLSYRPGLGVDELRRRLLDTAYPPPGGRPDPLLGSGVIDPAAAVTAELATAPPPPAAAPPPVRMPPPADPTPTVVAAALAAAAATLIGLVAWAAAVLPRGRRRGWRAAGRKNF